MTSMRWGTDNHNKTTYNFKSVLLICIDALNVLLFSYNPRSVDFLPAVFQLFPVSGVPIARRMVSLTCSLPTYSHTPPSLPPPSSLVHMYSLSVGVWFPGAHSAFMLLLNFLCSHILRSVSQWQMLPAMLWANYYHYCITHTPHTESTSSTQEHTTSQNCMYSTNALSSSAAHTHSHALTQVYTHTHTLHAVWYTTINPCTQHYLLVCQSVFH